MQSSRKPSKGYTSSKGRDSVCRRSRICAAKLLFDTRSGEDRAATSPLAPTIEARRDAGVDETGILPVPPRPPPPYNEGFKREDMESGGDHEAASSGTSLVGSTGGFKTTVAAGTCTAGTPSGIVEGAVIGANIVAIAPGRPTTCADSIATPRRFAGRSFSSAKQWLRILRI